LDQIARLGILALLDEFDAMAIRAAVVIAKRWLPLVEPAVGLWISRIVKNKDIVLEVERTPNCLKDLPGKLTAKRCLGQDELLS